jgi:hypothetical protein
MSLIDVFNASKTCKCLVSLPEAVLLTSSAFCNKVERKTLNGTLWVNKQKRNARKMIILCNLSCGAICGVSRVWPRFGLGKRKSENPNHFMWARGCESERVWGLTES